MRFYLFVQRAPLYNPLSPLYTHRRTRSSWSGYIATRYVASSSYILIRSPRSLNLCTLSPTISLLFSFSCSNRVQPSRSCPHDTRYSRGYSVYVRTSLWASSSASFSLFPFWTTDCWFLCMKLRFEPLWRIRGEKFSLLIFHVSWFINELLNELFGNFCRCLKFLWMIF